MNELVSDHTFRVLLSLIAGGVGGLWAIHDIVFLARLRGANRRDLDLDRDLDRSIADQRFGYAMGIIIGMIGVVGTLRYNGVL
jgi:hypothetical protein